MGQPKAGFQISLRRTEGRHGLKIGRGPYRKLLDERAIRASLPSHRSTDQRGIASRAAPAHGPPCRHRGCGDHGSPGCVRMPVRWRRELSTGSAGGEPGKGQDATSTKAGIPASATPGRAHKQMGFKWCMPRHASSFILTWRVPCPARSSPESHVTRRLPLASGNVRIRRAHRLSEARGRVVSTIVQ